MASLQLAAHALDEACVRRMNVENAKPASTWIAESMLNAAWRREERAQAPATLRPVNKELDLALDDVERVGVVRVSVGIDAPTVLERAFYHFQIRQLDEDAKAAVLSVQPLALALRDKESITRVASSPKARSAQRANTATANTCVA
jgi:hypothetical protein